MIKHKYFFNFDYFFSSSTIFLGLFGCDAPINYLIKIPLATKMLLRSNLYATHCQNLKIQVCHDSCKTYDNIIGGG